MAVFKYILLLLFSVAFRPCLGQEVTLDSNYVNEIILLAENQPNDSLLLDRIENGLLVARSINYQEGKLLIVQWLARYYKKRDNIAALRYYLEMLEGLNKGLSPELKEQTIFEIATIYQEEKLNDKALEYYRQLLAVSNQKPVIWESMGNAFIAQNQGDSAVHYFNKLYLDAKKFNNYKATIHALQQKVIALQTMGNLKDVVKLDLEILNLITNNNDDKLLATCYNNLGYNYSKLKDYENAIVFFKKAEEAQKKNPILDPSILYKNMGIAYQNSGDLNKAIKYLRKARVTLALDLNGNQFAHLTHLISSIYHKNQDSYNALIFNDEALAAAKLVSDKRVLSECYNTGAQIHQKLYDYEKALDYYKKHLALRDSFLLEERIRQQSVLQQQYLLERAEKEIKILLSNQEIKDLSINQLNLEKEKLELSAIGLKLEAEKRESELTVLRKEQEIKDANLKNKELEALQTQQRLRLTAKQLETEKQEREISELNRKEAEQRLALAEKDAEEQERLKEISMLNKDKELLTRQQEIAQLEIDKQDAFRQLAYGLGGLSLVILGLILGGLFLTRRSNKLLAKQKSEIEKNRDIIEEEKAKSDALLLNILPEETAEELKRTGAATPRKYELVTVLFTDFSGFTAITKHMTAEELITELNECFVVFDSIVAKYGLEKIKTIGDAYMCAGGIPTPNKSNPKDVVKAAIAMRKFMNERIAQKQQLQQQYWNMRIGIHSGAVIAGVVGSNKFAYDIWGDTVNIASRMESNGAEGAINISAATHAYIKNDFKCTSRGAIAVKNGGEVEMYFLERAL